MERETLPALDRILIVDDEPSTVELLSRILAREGFDVYFASSLPEAERLLARNTYDLLLLDVLMPGGSGYDLLKSLRSRAEMRDVPVIFLTGLSGTGPVEAAFDAGGQDFITKPFTAREVVARVRTHLELRHLRRQLAELLSEAKSETRAP